jgi:hypothetical protein
VKEKLAGDASIYYAMVLGMCATAAGCRPFIKKVLGIRLQTAAAPCGRDALCGYTNSQAKPQL